MKIMLLPDAQVRDVFSQVNHVVSEHAKASLQLLRREYRREDHWVGPNSSENSGTLLLFQNKGLY